MSIYLCYYRFIEEKRGREPIGREELLRNGSFASGESWGLFVTTEHFFNFPRQQGKIREVGFLSSSKFRYVGVDRERMRRFLAWTDVDGDDV